MLAALGGLTGAVVVRLFLPLTITGLLPPSTSSGVKLSVGGGCPNTIPVGIN